MKLLLIILFFIPFKLKAQTASDSLKYLYAQISIVKSLISTNKQEFNNYKIKNEAEKKVLRDSIAAIKTVIIFPADRLRKGATLSIPDTLIVN